jgi:hypothetical protein
VQEEIVIKDKTVSVSPSTYKENTMKTKIFGLMVAITVSLLLLGCQNPTNSTTDTVINIAAIEGVTAPSYGSTPVTAITETSQYTGTISWSPTVSGTYAASTVYTATITLTAKSGYTLSGVAADLFTVAGATTTNPVNSGVVTAVFPATVGDLISTSLSDLTLKAVKGGTFNNGTADMTVSSFHMSQHEVTMEQFVKVTGLANPSTSFTSVVNGPVQKVNWYYALVFCNKLSVADGLTPVYSIGGSTNTDNWGTVPTASNTTWDAAAADWTANGYRLPTETEWEFAARGGANSNGYTYSGSNTVGDVAWYVDNSAYTTHTVGTKAANELGLYDMSGNVWEWCWDWYGDYPTSAQTDYTGAVSGLYRVERGGCWASDAYNCSMAKRSINSPYFLSGAIGFRVVRR